METVTVEVHGTVVAYEPWPGEAPEYGIVKRPTGDGRAAFVIYVGEVIGDAKSTPIERLTRLDRQEDLRARFVIAIVEREAWCISGRCDDTNWGGRDRLHTRGSGCPPFEYAEVDGYLKYAERQVMAEQAAAREAAARTANSEKHFVSIQPAQGTDANAEHDPRKPLPYPYHVGPGGAIERQDFWRGSPSKLLGFQRGVQCSLVVSFEEFWADPDKAVGLCPVFIDEPTQQDKALLAKDLYPSRSPAMWADTRPITKVTVA